MTQTIDFATAEAPELNRWLAEQPCPRDWGWGPVGNWGTAEVTHIESCDCQGTGLAFPGASTVCLNQAEHHRLLGDAEVCHPECYRCNGSGRVPKDVGLELLFEHGITSVTQDPKPETKEEIYIAVFGWSLIKPPIGKGETPLLAALRAVCASVQR